MGVGAGLMGKRPAGPARRAAEPQGPNPVRRASSRRACDAAASPTNAYARASPYHADGIIGSESHGLRVRTDGGGRAIELLQCVPANAQRLGVMRIRRRPALGELDQLGPTAFGAQRRRAHEIRLGCSVALARTARRQAAGDFAPLALRGQAVADPAHRQRVVTAGRSPHAKRQQPDQRSGSVEKAASARAGRERGVRFDHARTVERVQCLHAPEPERLPGPAGEPDRGDRLARPAAVPARPAWRARRSRPGARRKQRSWAPSAYCPSTGQRLPPPEIRIVAASRVTWQLVTTTDGAIVTPLPIESPPCSRSASTLTTLADTETNVAGCSTCAAATELCSDHAMTIAQRCRQGGSLQCAR